MPGLVPGIHVLAVGKKAVDGRDKPGHDELTYDSNSDWPHHAQSRCRTRDRAPDPTARASARAWAALGASCGAASDQEARAAHGAAVVGGRHRDGENPGL